MEVDQMVVDHMGLDRTVVDQMFSRPNGGRRNAN